MLFFPCTAPPLAHPFSLSEQAVDSILITPPVGRAERFEFPDSPIVANRASMIENGPIANGLALLLIRNLPDSDVCPVVIRKPIHDAKAQIRPPTNVRPG